MRIGSTGLSSMRFMKSSGLVAEAASPGVIFVKLPVAAGAVVALALGMGLPVVSMLGFILELGSAAPVGFIALPVAMALGSHPPPP